MESCSSYMVNKLFHLCHNHTIIMIIDCTGERLAGERYQYLLICRERRASCSSSMVSTPSWSWSSSKVSVPSLTQDDPVSSSVPCGTSDCVQHGKGAAGAHSLPLSLTHSLSLSNSHACIHSLTHSLTLSLSLSLSHSLTHSLTHSLSLHTHTHIHTHTHTHAHTHTHTHSLTHSLPPSLPPSHTHSLSLPLPPSPFLSQSLLPSLPLSLPLLLNTFHMYHTSPDRFFKMCALTQELYRCDDASKIEISATNMLHVCNKCYTHKYFPPSQPLSEPSKPTTRFQFQFL